jgi:predicted tellurium resistance membrane protein TerC
MLQMTSDSLLLINAGAQFALVAIGGALLVREEWPRKHPVLTMGALLLVGFIGMFAAIRQSQISAKETADAQKRIIDTMTGGKSFCYIDLIRTR